MKPFIPAWLDELELKPAAFRVYCHLWRRGDSYSSAATIAKTCRLKRDTVFVVMSELEASGLIRKVTRTGQTSLIEPIPPNGAAPNEGTPPQTGHHPSPQTGHHPSPQTGHHPSPQTGHKGNPLKGIPDKGIPDKGIPKGKEEVLPFESEAFRKAWAEWKQHRKEMHKPITPLSAAKSLSDLHKMGEPRAVEAINHSIAKGWQGIYEPSKAKAATDHRQQKADSEFPEPKRTSLPRL